MPKDQFEGAFEGKSVLVSGGTSGIGLAIAIGFARAGAEVLATGSSMDRLRAARASDVPKGLRFDLLDVRGKAAAQGLIGGLSGLDVLVNCHGIVRPDLEWQEEHFAEVMDVNLSSVMRLSRAAFPLLKPRKGCIVNFASMLSYLADGSVPAYCASKSGILGLTRALAHQWGGDGVRVNAIAPGYHKTEMTKPLWSDPEVAERIAQRSAAKRWGTPEDLVGPTLFLASEAAGFVTGAVLPVDGGYHSG